MSDPTRIREAYELTLRHEGGPTGEGPIPQHVRMLMDAAQAYADLLEGNTEPDYGNMDEVPNEQIQKALDSYDLRLTKHWQIRILAHAATKFLILDAALADRRLLPGATQ